ncbi:hypothetical protein BJY01DRAFT_221464 [Aspergillus pseudoustus]|uniref:Uncharacterized protein n=1 Tax=Aspergillus pseudoustus TaxID=1810923 RepID=A0ABR4J9Z2_9EURO
MACTYLLSLSSGFRFSRRLLHTPPSYNTACRSTRNGRSTPSRMKSPRPTRADLRIWRSTHVVVRHWQRILEGNRRAGDHVGGLGVLAVGQSAWKKWC